MTVSEEVFHSTEGLGNCSAEQFCKIVQVVLPCASAWEIRRFGKLRKTQFRNDFQNNSKLGLGDVRSQKIEKLFQLGTGVELE